ncbi:zinc finger protein CCCH domain-containing protein 15, partial [Sigmodon hispidus]
MLPKKQAQAGGSKKTEQQQQKIIEDKTFCLKNNKGAKQQKFIAAVTHQVKFGQQNPRQVAQSEAEKKLKKDDKKEELQELNELFKPVVAAQKISNGEDPKSVLCEFFKQGQCTKGDKWKKRKRQEKIDKFEQDMERWQVDFKAGKALVISGCEVFEFHPELVNNDDGEADDTRYIQGTGGDEVDDSVGVNDIDVSLYIPRDVEETGITVASLERFSTYASDDEPQQKLYHINGLLLQ